MRNIEVTGVKTCGLPISEIVDAVNHVQLATNTTPGTSGPGPNPPAFVEGGNVVDNTVTWQAQGQPFWHTNFAFVPGSIIDHRNKYSQRVTTRATSGPTHPLFDDS